MVNKILVVDDAPEVVEIVTAVLEAVPYSVTGCLDAQVALQLMQQGTFSAIVSDFFMPGMDGGEFLKMTRMMNPGIPFIFLTANSQIEKVIEMFREGANDYLVKPFSSDELVYRVKRAIESYENKVVADRVRRETEIRDLESRKIANWRLLYAYKDTRAIDQILTLLRRNMDQSGGYIWIDILKEKAEEIDNDHYRIEKSAIDLILELAEKDRELFDIITYITNLSDMDPGLKEMTLAELHTFLQEEVCCSLQKLVEDNNMKISLDTIPDTVTGVCQVNRELLIKVMNELVINAIKYSPSGSSIDIFFDLEQVNYGTLTVITRNRPREMNASDLDGNPIIGIPYDYSELVFDLFFTIEPFINRIGGEEWIDGTGLYICRKIIQLMNGSIRTSRSIDYTGERQSLFNNIIISIPVNKPGK
jgi:DNA-binding response OmpR family regulator/two-component sensor histidine kinase